METPLETGEFKVWLRRMQPERNPGYRVHAHLDPDCHGIRRAGENITPVPATAETTTNRSYMTDHGATWMWWVRIPQPLVGLRTHFETQLCSQCLLRVLDAGLIPTPPLPSWWGSKSRHSA